MMLIRASLLILILWCNTSHAGLFGNDEELEALRKQASAMEARIAKMEQVLNNQGLIDLYSKVETLGIELNKLNGQIETLNNENSLLQKRQKDEIKLKHSTSTCPRKTFDVWYFFVHYLSFLIEN